MKHKSTPSLPAELYQVNPKQGPTYTKFAMRQLYIVVLTENNHPDKNGYPGYYLRIKKAT